MDIHFFFKQRLEFVRQLYLNSTAPFRERKRLIEEKIEPFVPSYSDDSEPPFLSEWLEADASLRVIGAACISMLAAALHVYVQTWVSASRYELDEHSKRLRKKEGWLVAHLDHFQRRLGIPIEKCPIDIGLLKEVILARNSTQHHDSIWSDEPSFSVDDLKKRPLPFFADDGALERFSDLNESERIWLSRPAIHVTPEKMAIALRTIEEFAAWFESVEVVAPALGLHRRR